MSGDNNGSTPPALPEKNDYYKQQLQIQSDTPPPPVPDRADRKNFSSELSKLQLRKALMPQLGKFLEFMRASNKKLKNLMNAQTNEAREIIQTTLNDTNEITATQEEARELSLELEKSAREAPGSGTVALFSIGFSIAATFLASAFGGPVAAMLAGPITAVSVAIAPITYMAAKSLFADIQNATGSKILAGLGTLALSPLLALVGLGKTIQYAPQALKDIKTTVSNWALSKKIATFFRSFFNGKPPAFVEPVVAVESAATGNANASVLSETVVVSASNPQTSPENSAISPAAAITTAKDGESLLLTDDPQRKQEMSDATRAKNLNRYTEHQKPLMLKPNK